VVALQRSVLLPCGRNLRTATPSPRDELENLIETDEGRIGDVFRLSREGLTPQEIADRLNVASYAFVYNNGRQIEAVS
jgi:DNA-binding NarL/FixJ family response regulator